MAADVFLSGHGVEIEEDHISRVDEVFEDVVFEAVSWVARHGLGEESEALGVASGEHSCAGGAANGGGAVAVREGYACLADGVDVGRGNGRAAVVRDVGFS